MTTERFKGAAEKYEENYRFAAAKYGSTAREIGRVILQYGKPTSMVDIAGRIGDFSKQLSEILDIKDVFVGDHSIAMRDAAEERGFKTFECDMDEADSIQKIPQLAKMDPELFLVFNAFHHCTNEEQFMRAMERALKPSAILAIALAPTWPLPEKVQRIRDRVYQKQVALLKNWKGSLKLMKEREIQADPFEVSKEDLGAAFKGRFLSWLNFMLDSEIEEYVENEIGQKDTWELPNDPHLFVFVKK